jgi:hypothetical protein
MLLSLFFASRNDGYQTNYIERMSNSLSFLLHSIYKSNLQNEVRLILYDYNSRIPLSEELRIPKEYTSNLEISYIEGAMREEMSDKKTTLPSPLLFNMALNTKATEYIFFGSPDQLILSCAIKELCRVCRSGGISSGLMLIERNFIPAEILNSDITFNDLEYVLENTSLNPSSITSEGGNAGLIGGSTKFLIEIGGQNEYCVGWGGNDIELYLRSVRYGRPYNLTKKFGIASFKLPYTKGGRRLSEGPNMEWVNYLNDISGNLPSNRYPLSRRSEIKNYTTVMDFKAILTEPSKGLTGPMIALSKYHVSIKSSLKIICLLAIIREYKPRVVYIESDDKQINAIVNALLELSVGIVIIWRISNTTSHEILYAHRGSRMGLDKLLRRLSILEKEQTNTSTLRTVYNDGLDGLDDTTKDFVLRQPAIIIKSANKNAFVRFLFANKLIDGLSQYNRPMSVRTARMSKRQYLLFMVGTGVTAVIKAITSMKHHMGRLSQRKIH